MPTLGVEQALGGAEARSSYKGHGRKGCSSCAQEEPRRSGQDGFAQVCTLPGVGAAGNEWKMMPSGDTGRLRLCLGEIKEMDDPLELEPLEISW